MELESTLENKIFEIDELIVLWLKNHPDSFIGKVEFIYDFDVSVGLSSILAMHSVVLDTKLDHLLYI